MRLLLDTHIALWLAQGGDALSRGERALLEEQGAELVISAVSLWELRLKWNSAFRSGERKGPAEPRSVHAALRQFGCVELALTLDDAAADLAHPIAHKDPFDELLLVHAQEHNLRLLTRDAKLAGHPLAITG